MHLLRLLTFFGLAFTFVLAIGKRFQKSLKAHEKEEQKLENVKKKTLKFKIPFKRGDGKIRFQCSKSDAFSQETQERLILNELKKAFKVVSEDADLSEIESRFWTRYQDPRGSATDPFKMVPFEFSRAYLLDFDEMRSLFSSSMDFFKELKQKSEMGQLNNAYLASTRIYNNIRVEYAKEELILTYPFFWKMFMREFQVYLKTHEKIPNDIPVGIEALTQMNRDLMDDFERMVKIEYLAVLKSYCNEYNAYEISTLPSQNSPNEIHYEARVEMVLDKSENIFECHYPVKKLVKDVFYTLLEYQKKVLEGLKQLCSLTDTPFTPASQKFQLFPTERSAYLGPVFLKRLKECVTTSLPEISKEWYAQKKDVENFATDVNAITGNLMERHERKVLMSTPKIESNGVSSELKKNGVVFFQWKPIFDIRRIDGALMNKNSQSDEQAPEMNTPLNVLRGILENYKALQAFHIRYVLYESWKAICK